MKRLSDYIKTVECYSCRGVDCLMMHKITLSANNYEVVVVCKRCRKADGLRFDKGELPSPDDDDDDGLEGNRS